MKTALMIAALALGTAGMAQDKMSTTTTDPAKCLMKADKESLASMGLDATQMEKVFALQKECKQADMASTDKGAVVNTRSTADEGLKSILTPDQLKTWNTWCANGKAQAAPSKSSDATMHKQ